MKDNCQLDLYGEREISSCAFSGHRLLGKDFCEKDLEKSVSEAIEKGAKTFYCGMAMGFDLVAAECVLKEKEKNSEIRIVACVPCYGQERGYSERDKRRYAEILKKCDEKVVLSDSYYNGCMQKRNEYMAERSDALIAYCRKQTGGTVYTVKCFKRKGKPVFEI